jgi:hypothetical protein
MSKVSVLIIVAIAAVVAVGLGLLAAWDIPAPTAPVEKIVPDDRFPH